MPSARTLACPASLKGVLYRAPGSCCARPGIGTSGRRRRVAGRRRRARERWTCCSRCSAANGERRTCRRIRSAAHARWLWHDGDAYGVEAAEASRSIRSDSTRCGVVAGLGRADRARSGGRGGCSSASAEPRTSTAGAGLLEVLGELPAPTQRGMRRRRPAGRRGARVRRAEGSDAASSCRARAPARARWRSTASPNCPAPARPAASERRSPLSAAELMPGAALVLDLLGFDPAGLRPRRHG